MEDNKCVLIGVTGGIAVYKICTLVSSLKKQGYEVHVLMTENAQKFVTPLTFQTLSAQRVITDMFSTEYEPDVHHISLAKKADAFVIAPATADVIAKVANGIADDMLTTTFLASTCPKMIVPAMNTHMLLNPVTQDNLEKCRHYGMMVLSSGDGYLACGDKGPGRMPEPYEIEDAIKDLLETDKYLKGKKVLVTAGPTQEDLDPVRYLTNHSTGRMGFALARAARNAGAEVTLVAGYNTLRPLSGVETINVRSSQEMADAVLPRQKDMDIMVLAAAVADYRPVRKSDEKIHKGKEDWNIEVEKTTDILEELGKHKKEGQLLIGFSMETRDLIKNSRRKLEKKNCDFIVANNLKTKGAGFAGDTNVVTILSKDAVKELGLLSKDDTAKEILSWTVRGHLS